MYSNIDSSFGVAPFHEWFVLAQMDSAKCLCYYLRAYGHIEKVLNILKSIFIMSSFLLWNAKLC